MYAVDTQYTEAESHLSLHHGASESSLTIT